MMAGVEPVTGQAAVDYVGALMDARGGVDAAKLSRDAVRARQGNAYASARLRFATRHIPVLLPASRPASSCRGGKGRRARCTRPSRVARGEPSPRPPRSLLWP